jgi:hypothetical protein
VSSDLEQDIYDSVDDIDDLLKAYEGLLEKVKDNKPDIVEIAALGSILQSFYNGVEGIFVLIVKQIDRQVPSDSAWHQTLLNQVLKQTDYRDSVITPDTASDLAPYMKFRHFFRHAYTFMLDWERLQPLVNDLYRVWVNTSDDIFAFCRTLSDAPNHTQ